MLRIKGPVGIITPFIWMSGSSDDRVLVEIQKVFILENGKIGVANIIELKAVSVGPTIVTKQ